MTLTCYQCSDEIEENLGSETTPVGRCCHNLPEPWHRGREGLYTETTPSHDDDDEPYCLHCGGSSFVAREEQLVSRYVSYDGETLVVGDSFDVDSNSFRVVCDSCETRYNGDWEYE